MSATLYRAVWTDLLLTSLFETEEVILNDAKNFDAFVNADTVNWAKAGAKPTITKNAALGTTPSALSQRTDSAKAKELDYFRVEPILIQAQEIIELAYPKVESIIRDAGLTLREKLVDSLHYEIGPAADTAATPVFVTSGPASPDGARIALSSADFGRMSRAFDNLKYPKTGRRVVMPPDMFWDMVLTDPILREQFNRFSTGTIPSALVNVYGWEVYVRNGAPYYYNNSGTWTKRAEDAVINPATDFQAAIFYIRNESFARALGSVQMFEDIGNPVHFGDIYSWEVRFGCARLDERFLGAIVQGEY